MPWIYDQVKAMLESETLPAAIVDLDLLDANIKTLSDEASRLGKTIRIATKSVRVPHLIKYILEKSHVAKGVMCYSAPEARLLGSQGLDDILLAYPIVQKADYAAVQELVSAGKKVTVMLDSDAHLKIAAGYWPGDLPPLNVCIDVDMSYRPFFLHLGVKRSPIRSLEQFASLVENIAKNPKLRLAGVMGYEAQVAGVPDRSPFTPLTNIAIRLMKYFSVRDVRRKREGIFKFLHDNAIQLDFFNGGGTGSLPTTVTEPWVTEVTVGSGFLQSHLFDYYRDNRREPALCFALAVTRIPDDQTVTCQSGGFVASGATSPDKSPVAFLPEGLAPWGSEGFGEVQTPLKRGGNSLSEGDPVLFRPAKAGEIAERFSTYLLKRGEEFVDIVATYRGLGYCFY